MQHNKKKLYHKIHEVKHQKKQKKESQLFENSNEKVDINNNDNEENEIKDHINELKKKEIDPDLLEIEEMERQ